MDPEPLAELPPGLLADFMAGLAIMDGRGLTEGFGHLSARAPAGLLMTPALAPGLATPADLVLLGPDGEVRRAAPGVRPALETPLHLAIYQSRPDCGALPTGT
jgi:ribulose-5-phosphate 4-epimerase/fuculose-1-phosphate aldolase